MWKKKKDVEYLSNLTLRTITSFNVLLLYSPVLVQIQVLHVLLQKRLRVFHRGFKHEKTDESARPQAECFYCFRVFETPMKHYFSNSLIIYAALTQPEHLVIGQVDGFETQ